MKSKNQKFTRNAGGQEFGHGGTDPKALGPTGNNQNEPGRTQVSLVPADAPRTERKLRDGE